MVDRILIIGADAAGMSAAHQALRTARRLSRRCEVIVLEQSSHTSYSACGIPYWIAGDVADASELVARSAQGHRDAGVDLRMQHEAVGLDLAARRCEVRDHLSARTFTLDFDQVMLATGAAPICPPWSLGSPSVRAVTTLDDGAAWQQLLATKPRAAVVVGGGYIGVETAEAFARRGVRTTLLNRGQQLMAASLESGTAEIAQAGLAALGVDVIGGVEIVSREQSVDGVHRLVAVDGRSWTADVVAVSIGVLPRSGLATAAGIPDGGITVRGALVPDDQGRVGDGVWAAGDCTAVTHRLLRQPVYQPLGTHANKTGRVVGTNLGGGRARFPGIVGTAITRAGQMEISRTGIVPRPNLGPDGVDTLTKVLQSHTIAGYMPGAEGIRVWVAADATSRQLLGCQIGGGVGSGKRIDTAATAIWNAMTIDEIGQLDLAYAPPFSSVWDPVQLACRSLADHS